MLSLLDKASLRPSSRPSTQGQASRPGSGHPSVLVPPRSSSASVKAGPQHIARQATNALATNPDAKSLIHGYMVCGLARSPEDWLISAQPAVSKAHRIHGSIGPFVQPTILGSIPPQDKDAATVRMFAAALKAAFPDDAEVCAVDKAPPSTCHAFVLQHDSDESLYGVALRLWVKSDAQRTGKILEVLSPNDPTKTTDNTTLWMPYCLTYISHYPLFDLMSDYLRCTWMLFGKDPDKFNSNGVLRLTRMPPPRPEQFLRVDLDKYTFCYKMPSHPEEFQNFAMWPLFTCITPVQMVAVIEAALSSRGRIVFTSAHYAILTMACETIRHYVKTWAGLYVPVAYAGHVQQLLEEPAPYMLGVTKQSRALTNPPKDALVVDLDAKRIYTSRPPGSLSPRQRKRYTALLSQALGKVVADGPPPHLKSAYEQNFRFSAVGSIVATGNTPKAVHDPAWWDPVKVSSVINHICKRTRQNYKLLSALDSMRNQSVKVNVRDLTKMVHHRNCFARESNDAWDTYIKLKRRTDVKIGDLLKHEEALESSIEDHKKEFADLSECTEQLIEDTRQMQKVVNQQKRDNARVTDELRDKTIHAKQLSSHVTELQYELKEATRTLAMQQELIEEIERSRDTAKMFENRFEAVSSERDEAHRAVIHLTSLISGQITYIERVLGSLLAPTSRPSSRTESRSSRRRSFQSIAGGSPVPSPGFSSPQSRRHTADFSANGSSALGAAIAAHTSSGRCSSPLSQMETPNEEPSLKEKVGAVVVTVRKINQQCLTTIQELNDKRAEMDADGDAAEPLDPAQTPPPAQEVRLSNPQSLVSRLIQQRLEDVNDDAGSQISRGTLGTFASAVSSLPDLESRLSSIRTDSANDLHDDDSFQQDRVEPRIQAIEEEDEGEAEGMVEEEPVKLFESALGDLPTVAV